MKTGFIGAGKVGTSLGKLFSEKGIFVTGYYSRHKKSAAEAAAFTGSADYDDVEKLIQDSDTIFLTVPDDVISEVFQTVQKFDIRGRVLAHCSGALSAAEAFPGAEASGAAGISLHPLFPVSDRFSVWREMSDAFFCLEGDREAVRVWETDLRDAGLHVRTLKPGSKIRYHAACSISSNLVVALAAESLRLLQTCGFTEPEARQALAPLMQSNLNHILQDGPVSALTGPVERGDTATLEKHLRCLETHEEKRIYAGLSLQLESLAEKKHPDRDYTGVKDLLQTGTPGEANEITSMRGQKR